MDINESKIQVQVTITTPEGQHVSVYFGTSIQEIVKRALDTVEKPPFKMALHVEADA